MKTVELPTKEPRASSGEGEDAIQTVLEKCLRQK